MPQTMNPLPTLSYADRVKLFYKIAAKCHYDYDGPLDTPCWVVNTGRSGTIDINKTTFYFSRILPYILTGKDPGNLYSCHTCNRGHSEHYKTGYCVSPLHLYYGTAQQNIQEAYDDGIKIGNQGVQLTRKDAAQIRYLRQCGFKVGAIAGLYNVSRSHISNIINDRFWRR